MTTKIEKMLAQVLASQDAMAKEMATLKAENESLKVLASTKVPERKKPNAHGYLKPTEQSWAIDKGKRKGELVPQMQFPHFAKPQYNFNISVNKAAAIIEYLEDVKAFHAKYPPKAEE